MRSGTHLCFGLGGYFDEPDQDDFDYNLIDCPDCDGNDDDCATCGGWGQIREPDEEASQ